MDYLEYQERVEQVIRAQHLDPVEVENAINNYTTRVENAVTCLKSRPLTFKFPYVGTSGGKDSIVVSHLARQALYDDISHLHTVKPGVTHPKTIQFMYEQNLPTLYLPKDFLPPAGFKTQIDGTRRAEWNRTDGRSTDVIIEGKTVSREQMTQYVRHGLFGLNFVFPILEWSDAEVWHYIFENKLPFSDEYLEDKDENVIAPGAK